MGRIPPCFCSAPPPEALPRALCILRANTALLLEPNRAPSLWKWSKMMLTPRARISAPLLAMQQTRGLNASPWLGPQNGFSLDLCGCLSLPVKPVASQICRVRCLPPPRTLPATSRRRAGASRSEPHTTRRFDGDAHLPAQEWQQRAGVHGEAPRHTWAELLAVADTKLLPALDPAASGSAQDVRDWTPPVPRPSRRVWCKYGELM